MDTIDSTNFRKNLSASMDKVSLDHEPLLITRQKGENAVLMSEADFRSFEEMRHLTASTSNIKAINDGIQDINEGRFEEISLDDL